MTTDLDGPLQEFYLRTQHIRRILVTVESAAANPGALSTNRPQVDLSGLDAESGNTVNAMAIVFLASSFEEFVREEFLQCAAVVASRYRHFPEDMRHSVRSAYWLSCLDSLRRFGNVASGKRHKRLDTVAIGKVKVLVDSVRGFVVEDDAWAMDPRVAIQHMNNFRPAVVDEIAKRFGISSLVEEAADSSELKALFGVGKRQDSAAMLRSRLNDFYERRNEIVHSLNSAAGYAVDIVFTQIELMEKFSESIKAVLTRHVARWSS